MEKQIKDLQTGDWIYDVYWYDDDGGPRISNAIVYRDENEFYYMVKPDEIRVNIDPPYGEFKQSVGNIIIYFATTIDAAIECKNKMISKKNKENRIRYGRK